LPTYQGNTGYQPVVALWAKMDVIVAQQFRDGNLSAQKDPLSVAKQAYLALPEHIRERWFRGNSGCYEQELLRWLRHRNCAEGPGGFIGFAISARMSDALNERTRMSPEALWKPYREDADAILECTELFNYDPVEKRPDEELDAVRYLGDSRAQPARSVIRRPDHEVFRSGDQHLGRRRDEERTGGGGFAVCAQDHFAARTRSTAYLRMAASAAAAGRARLRPKPIASMASLRGKRRSYARDPPPSRIGPLFQGSCACADRLR